jgi:hypothetical protein
MGCNLALHEEEHRWYIVVNIGYLGLPVIRIYYPLIGQKVHDELLRECVGSLYANGGSISAEI